MSRKSFFPIQNIIEHHVQVFFKLNETQKNYKFLREIIGRCPTTFLQSRKPFFTFRTFIIMSRYFSKKMRLIRNFKFLRQITGSPLRKNGHCSTVLKYHFCSPESFFPIQNIIKHHVEVFSKENKTQKNFQIFEENPGLPPLAKWSCSEYVKMTFLQSRKFFFIQNIFKHYKFVREIMGYPLWKNGHFATMLK